MLNKYHARTSRRWQLVTLWLFAYALVALPALQAPAGALAWDLVWSDEFNGGQGAAVDTSRWAAEVGGSGWGNNERQYYTDTTRNAATDGNGSLVITAIKETLPPKYRCWYGACQYTSARLITKKKFEQAYGRFEARIKIPFGQGLWPAFWMLANNIDKKGWPACGEIDVMENIGREPAVVHGTIHGPGYSGVAGSEPLTPRRTAHDLPTIFISTESSGSRTPSAGMSTGNSTRREPLPISLRGQVGSSTIRSSSS